TYLHNRRLGKVLIKMANRVDLDYLYWLFLWPTFNRHLAATASGTKILHTSPSRIEDFQFPLPPIEEQRVIASMLRSLNDKIEVSRQMNRTLERMAGAIFKAWFIDFEPVHAKATGATNFPLMPQEVFDALPASFSRGELGPL